MAGAKNTPVVAQDLRVRGSGLEVTADEYLAGEKTGTLTMELENIDN